MKIPLPEFPNRLPQSFMVGQTRHLFSKAGRELAAFINDNGSSWYVAGDAGLNFAMSIWHLHDWLWADLTEDSSGVAYLSASLGVPITKKEDFVRVIYKKCPAMRICRVIATAGKHVDVTKFPDPTLRTHAPLSKDENGVQRREWHIEAGGRNRPAADIFKEAFRFWEDLLSDLAIIEDPIFSRMHRKW